MTKIGNGDKGKQVEPAMRGTHRNGDPIMLLSYYKWAANLEPRVLGATEKRRTKRQKVHIYW